jgi:hypothetical protein
LTFEKKNKKTKTKQKKILKSLKHGLFFPPKIWIRLFSSPKWTRGEPVDGGEKVINQPHGALKK